MFGLSIAAFLATAVLGWKVLTWAQKEKNVVKTAGQWVGWLVMIVSFVAVVGLGACGIRCTKDGACGHGKSCGWSETK